MHGYGSSRNDEQKWHGAGINVQKIEFVGNLYAQHEKSGMCAVMRTFLTARHKLLLSLRLGFGTVVKTHKNTIRLLTGSNCF